MLKLIDQPFNQRLVGAKRALLNLSSSKDNTKKIDTINKIDYFSECSFNSSVFRMLALEVLPANKMGAPLI